MVRISRLASALALTLVASASIADERYQSAFNRTLPYRGGTVNVEHDFGGVTINTGSSPEVVVRATISSSDPEFARQIRIDAESSASGVNIRTHYPSGNRKGELSFSVDYRITIPANAPLRVQNRFGSISAAGLTAKSELVNSHGSIALARSRGAQTLQNRFGSIAVSDHDGNLALTNSHGSVSAQAIRGVADIKNRFGSVAVTDVDRDITVENGNGSVHIRDVRGNADVSNPFGSITIEDVTGNVKADGSHSRVIVRRVRGDATIAAGFGTVDVESIGGLVTVTNQNGSVKATDVGRDLRVKTSFASVMASDVRGLLDVENQNGAISVAAPRTAQCRPMTLRTSFSTIKVALPQNASYSVNARTTYGRIHSELPIQTRTVGDDTVIGTIGGGTCKLELVNANGNINIERE